MSFYTYLISSLPMLSWGGKPPFSFESFLDRCRDLFSGTDFEVLKSLRQEETFLYFPEQRTQKKWLAFDTAVRNELARVRAARLQKEASAYLRPEPDFDPLLAHAVDAIARHANPLDGEKALDELRWRRLDDFCAGHYFDLDFLVIYGHKLLILERWARIQSADATQLVEELTGRP